MSEIKQYDTEVRLEAVMGTNHYGVHIHAMTTEDLHSKSGIAVELAWRDLRIEQLIAQLEAAQGNIKELESKVNHYVAAEYAHKHFDQTPDIIKRADSAELELVKVKAELSAANEKLSKPVVLPPRRSASYFVDEEFSNEDLAAIYNAARLEFSVKVKNAGFTVEGE
ncbi:TPA: hypothetical protein PXN30_002731 [Yersinia enterocolitica]|uniref:hypothetical protein n=1 Tax=Yersinia enterocolitica TaxID=630 RepID=UPI0005E371B8|nr:hypothetical protein [Yersinia enterocolitica]EKN4829499.1 hypothetical protein [Yersinia enterocolitica]EKN4850740.1 hypothetical protein [Yersinia enterocolitica]ELW8175891.1 hypothetical protein [Yersinia enterocolitica]ELY5203101.1 hypothetical protein [Yersinia enterocolitica]MCE3111504.1 hypothetical protein [Yersinia enterocolitica]